MLINTKHIVMFDDAANDFSRITDMVDNDGSVLIIKDGRPAYAVVSFDEVQEADRPATGSTPKAEEATCGCGKPQSQCGCGGHGKGHGHGSHGTCQHGTDQHRHGDGCGGGQPRFEHGHRHGQNGGTFTEQWQRMNDHAETFFGGHGQAHADHFGHGADAGHIFHEESSDGPEGGNHDWDFSFQHGRGFDPLYEGVSVDDFIGRVPPELLKAGKHFVDQLGPIINLFGTSVNPTAAPPNNDQGSDNSTK